MRVSQVVTTLAQLIVAKLTSLDDTPSSYTGNAAKSLTVNAGETATEFVKHATSTHADRHENGRPDEINVAGLSGELADAQPSNFLKLTDTPSAFTGEAGKSARVNTAEDALEFATPRGSNPMTTAGDLIYGGTSGAETRLAKGTTGQYLQQGATNPGWATLSAGWSYVYATTTEYAMTNLTVSGLDLDTDKAYYILFYMKEGASATNVVSLYFNGCVTATDYYFVAMNANTSGVGHDDANTAEIGRAFAGKKTLLNGTIVQTSGNEPYYIGTMGADETTNMVWRTRCMYSTITSNVTSTTMSTNQTNGIGIGSYLAILKRS